jgi:hypothetical protein
MLKIMQKKVFEKKKHIFNLKEKFIVKTLYSENFKLTNVHVFYQKKSNVLMCFLK